MSQRLIDRSPDLRKLRDDGYDIEVVDGYLLVKDVPYVDAQKQIKRGVLISKLALANDVSAKPDTHVIEFAGEYPCDKDGSPIERIRSGTTATKVREGLVTAYSFSAKPQPSGSYEDYHKKIVT